MIFFSHSNLLNICKFESRFHGNKLIHICLIKLFSLTQGTSSDLIKHFFNDSIIFMSGSHILNTMCVLFEILVYHLNRIS